MMDLEELVSIQDRSSFIFYLPSKYEITDLSFREEGEKWSTLRYFVSIENQRLRVKEFFLDWFYTGFPKSLMNSFVSTYSSVEVAREKGNLVFIGQNYKGKLASSSFLMGTQIEIEGGDIHSLKALNLSMTPLRMDERFRNMGFVQRSFFARNGIPQWFEEERIHRMTWADPPQFGMIDGMIPDSFGAFRLDGRVVNTFLIYRSDFFSKVIWVDITSSTATYPHSHYELRSGEGLFDYLQNGDGHIAFVDDSGPAIYQEKSDDFVVTITFSDIESFSRMSSNLLKLREIVQKIKKNYF